MEQLSSGQRAQRSGRLATTRRATAIFAAVKVASVIIFVILAASPVEPSAAATMQQELELREDQLADSIYRQVPLLFGADLIGDYYTEPVEDRPTTPPPTKLPVVSTASKKTVGPQKAASSGSANRFATSSGIKTTTKSPRLKRNPVREPSSATASVQELVLSGTKGGVSMDHVINSLGLVVEAMRQQTMAMQMISGQMAATKGGAPSDKDKIEEKQQAADRLQQQQQQSQADARSLLESFGEVLSGIKGSSSSTSTAPNSPSARSRAVLESLREIMAKNSGKASNTQQPLEEPVSLIQSRPVQQLIEIMQQQQQQQEVSSSSSSSSSQAPTSSSITTSPSTFATSTTSTTTSTTTTTPAPGTSTTTTQAPSSSTTTATTKEPQILMISGIRSSTESPLPKRKVMPEIVTYDSYANKQKGGWRRLVPFDYYPYSDAGQLAAEMPRSPGIMSETGIEELPLEAPQQHNTITAHHVMKSVGLSYPVTTSGSHLAPSPAPIVDNYRSVGMPGYGVSAQAQTQVPQMQVAAPQMIQQQHQIQAKLPPVMVQYQQPSMTIQQQQVQQNSLEAAIMNAMMAQQQPQKPAMAEMVQMQHVMQQLEAQQQPQPQPQAMMQLAGITQQQPQVQAQALQQQTMEEPLSDEIPRPPAGGVKGLFGMPSNKAPSSSLKSPVGALKIGERPQFDPSNFQMLDAAGQQQHTKQTMAMLQQVLDAAQEQQQQQQEQQQDQQDLSANASQQTSDVVVKTNGKGGNEEEARQVKAPNHPQALQQPPPQSANRGPSFSILGGRFKITPHTQMLHYLLEPSKMILQQALNLMGPPPAPPAPMGPPAGGKGRRSPRRGKSSATSTTRRPTAKANGGKQQLSPGKTTATSSSKKKQ